MKKISVLFLLSILITIQLSAQTVNYQKVGTKMAHLLFSKFQNRACPDSIGMYSFAVTVILNPGAKEEVEILVPGDGALFNQIFQDMNILKTIDFSEILVQKKHIQLILPIAVMVLTSRTSSLRPSVYIDDIGRSLDKLLTFDEKDNSKIYLRPYVIRAYNKPSD